MADTRVFSNGYVNIVFIPVNGVANPKSPTAAEINAGLNVSLATAWDGTTVPTMTESSDVDDRSILDAGNASTRGFAQFEGTLQFFYPRDLNDVVSDYGKVFQMLRLTGGDYWVVTRILQNVKGQATTFSAGQYISIFKFKADAFVNNLDGEDSYKYSVELLPQGTVYPNTLVKLATPPTVVNASSAGSLAVGGHAVLRATLGTHRATQLVEWTSSNPQVATVSPNGVVTAHSTGTASITASHPAATGDSTPITITVA